MYPCYVSTMCVCKIETVQSKSRLPQVFSSEELAQVRVLAGLPSLACFGWHSCRNVRTASWTALFLLSWLLEQNGRWVWQQKESKKQSSTQTYIFLFKAIPCTDLQIKLQEFLHFYLDVLLQALYHSWWMMCICAVLITLIVLEPLKTGGDTNGLNSKTRLTFSWITEQGRD